MDARRFFRKVVSDEDQKEQRKCVRSDVIRLGIM